MKLDEILTLTCERLREKLVELGLPTQGRKEELQKRLITHYGITVTDLEEADDQSVHTARESVDMEPIVTQQFPMQYQERSRFTLRDIEDSLTLFTGTDSMSIEDWVQEFEENASIVGWDDRQKFIYAKQLLRGAAKLFIRSQQGINSWLILQEALISEFGENISAAEIHSQLRSRRKQKGETLMEYLYTLAEIGKRCNLDDGSLIGYFCDGIPDSKQNKLPLYQATTVRQLKEAIKVYDRMFGSGQSTSTVCRPAVDNRRPFRTEIKKEVSAVRRCYRCGADDHTIRDCKDTDVKCFRCNQRGHRSFECKSTVKPATGESSRRNNANMMALTASSMMFKDVVVADVCFSALVDTGCDLCLLRNDVLVQLGEVKLNSEQKVLHGIANGKIQTLGSLEKEVKVDGICFMVTFHVVKETDICFPAVLGSDVLKRVNMCITDGRAYFSLKSFKRNARESDSPVQVIQQSDTETTEFNEFYTMAAAAAEGEWQVEKEVQLNHLRQEDRKTITDLITTYKPSSSCPRPIEMKILVKDEQPVYQRARRVSFADQQTIERQVAEWLRDGIIRPSVSPYASPVVLVAKKDGSKRLCCDFRKINEKIIRDNYPMPLIDDVLERLQRAVVFTTLDLKDGFFHVPMEASSAKYTAFVTSSGQYEFNYAPFGISNSPAVFTRFITAVMRDLIQSGTVILYMDDMVIPAADEKEAILKLYDVLQQGAKFGLRFKWQKCQFLVKKVNFLGYVVEKGTIRPSEDKLSAVTNFPLPVTKQAVQRFVGLTSYFRRFIENYALIARPLTNMLRGDAEIVVGDEQVLAFEQLKTALIKAPVLKLFNPEAETEIHTDASMHGYGGVLLQRDSEDQEFHPIQYMSRKTKPYEEKLHSYELEVLAVIEALKKWRVYVLGRPFKIITDCNAFAQTMNKKDIPAKVSRWAMFLQEFDYTIQHRSGSAMKHVDALSRSYCLLAGSGMRHRLREEQLKDDWVRAVNKLLEHNVAFEDYFIKHGVLHKDPIKELIVVPEALEEEVINIAHRQGHYAAKKTQDLVEREYFIPSLAQKVGKVVNSCIECIITEAKLGKKEGMLNPINKADRPLLTYHVDHVGPMETTKKMYNYILVIVDGFSKFVWLYPTKTTGAEEVVRSLEKQAVIFGDPERIISDRGSAFTSACFSEYCAEHQIQHLVIATGVPRGNGQVERIHRVVVPMLAKLCHGNSDQWYKHVGTVQQFINNATSRSTGETPFRILTGLKMRIAPDVDLKRILEAENLKEYDEERDKVRENAKISIQAVQNENKRSYDRRRKVEQQYEVGELVAIKRTQFGTAMKLRAKFLGPYKVVERMNHGRYKVEKVGEREGPKQTVTVAENMKKWGKPSEGGRQNRMAEL